MGFFSKSSGKNNDDDKWKHKYLNLLDTQELLEKAQKPNQELLFKTIVRLSILSSGIDPALEPYLQCIRDNIKKGINYPQLQNELENLTSAITRLDTGKKDKDDPNKEINVLFDFLRHRYSSETQKTAISLLENSYRTNDDKEQLFVEINQIIDSHNPEEPSNENEPLVEPFGQEKSLFEDSEKDPSSLPLLANDSDLITAPILKLLDSIEIPDSLTNKAEELKQLLVDQEQIGSYETLWDNLTTLLIEINTKNQTKQQEIDKFLNHITQQLTELGLTITDSGIALMDASLSRSRLDQSVSEQMDDLQNRSSNATQLEPLKQVISSHIAKISIEIQEHKQNEAIQREKYQLQLDELSQKIKVMEQETGELQSKLETANSNAQRDVLTNLPNRLAYDDRLKMEMARWQRYHTPLCLVIIDIDYFKRINDQYGHQAGDKMLEHVAALFSNNIRRADFVARIGGEEFAMLLPHTNKHSAVKLMDKLLALVEQSQLILQDMTIATTISCGITQFLKGDTHESAFKRSDEALYRAKDQGRNKCCTS
jgi:diguanylate cyclase